MRASNVHGVCREPCISADFTNPGKMICFVKIVVFHMISSNKCVGTFVAFLMLAHVFRFVLNSLVQSACIHYENYLSVTNLQISIKLVQSL